MSPLDPKKSLPHSKPLRPAPETQAAVDLPKGLNPSWASLPDMGSYAMLPGPPQAPPPAPAPGMSTVIQALRRRWPLLVSLGVVGAALVAAAVWFWVPPQYAAQSLLEMGRPPRGTYEGDFDLIAFKRTQAALLKGGPVLQATLQDPEVAALPLIRGQEDPFVWLDKNLITDDLQGPGILRVTLTGSRPQDLPVVLNKVIQAYQEEFRRNELIKIENWRKKLQSYYAEAKAKLRKKRDEYNDKSRHLGVDDPETLRAKFQIAQQKLGQIQGLLFPKEQELTRNNVELKTLRPFLKNPDQIEISGDALEQEYHKEKSILAVEDALAKIDLDILAYKEVAVAGGPELQQLQEKRDNAEKSLATLKKNLRPALVKRLRAREHLSLQIRKDQLERENAYLEEQRDSLLQRTRELEAEIERLRLALNAPERFLNSPLKDLHDGIEQDEATVKRINEELATLAIGAGSPPVTVREQAKVPTGMDVKRQVKLAGAAGLGVFALVFMGVFWVEYRGRRVYAAEDVVQGLGINLVGTLPALPARSRRPLPASSRPRDLYWQNLMTESVDVVRTVLLHTAQSSNLRVVMVTSAVGGEGKTSVASHLAASLARSWRKTLLIDCDLRNPAAHQQFDLPLEPGLSEVLRSEVELEDVIRSTPVSRLWMIPAGKWDTHAIQALAQQEVHTLFERLKEQFDFIVIDSCPVLPVADSLLIGQHADAALFSILRDVSRMPAVQAAYQRMSQLGIRMLGAVVVGEKVDSYGQNYHYLTHASND